MPKAKFRFATLAVCGLIVAGCSENRNSIFRTFEIEPGKGPSIVTGSKQRVITNIDIVNTSVAGQVLPKRIVCAEPSPDVAQGVSQALQAGFEASEGGGGAGGSGQFGFSSAAAVAQLGERLAVIQLLRDRAYRACEAFANGAINATGYTILNSRLNKTMVTLLSSEMTAGAFGRALAQISGSAATASGDSAATAEAKEEMKVAVANYESAKADRDKVAAANAAGSAAVGAADKKLQTAEDAVVEKAVKLAATQAGAASTAAAASAGKEGTLGQISGTRPSGVSGDLARIHRQFMDANSFDTLLDACVTSLDFARFKKSDLVQQDGEETFSLNYKDEITKLKASPFNKMCLTKVIPEAVEIATRESSGKVKVQNIRATNEGLLSVVEVVKFCADEKNATTPGCANLDKLLAAKAGP
jgi:hypothetical protein